MFRTIPIWEVDHYIDNGSNVMIIDLRDRASYRRGHIQGAVNLPMRTWTAGKAACPWISI